ncbi:MAG: AAA family ATPase [Lachnospiraceae bacterium]|nr:AAA family ATPase [Lachnospiraceae bacterium]
MGLFDKKSEDNNQMDRFEDIVTDVQNMYSVEKDKKFLEYLTYLKYNPGNSIIRPIDLLCDTLEAILQNKANFGLNNHMNIMRKAEEVYKNMFLYEEKTPGYDLIRIIYLEMFSENGVLARNLFNSELYNTFKYKMNYLELMKSLLQDVKAQMIIYDLVQYGLKVRSYYIEEDMYTANMKYVASRMLIAGDRQAVAAEESLKVERMAGVYNIDETAIATTEKQLTEANILLKQSLEILEQADRKTEQISRIMQDTTKTITDISKRETDVISAKALSAKSDINAAYNSFLEEQKQEVILQKDVLVDQIFKESETKLNELRHMARAITATATSELSRINSETSSAIDKINNYVNNDDIEKIISKAEENEELLNKIRRLELLNDKNITVLEKNLGGEPQDEGGNTQGVSTAAVSMQPMNVSYGYTSTATVMEQEPAVIPEINPLLDTSVPFEQRYKLVMDEKKRREEAGEHFHKMFDDVVIALMEDANPYMIGPSGCGKTFMVKQIASILNMDFIDIGYINEEYDILGFQTATGGYSTPNFYRCYKYGRIAFCDELDNGNSRATVKLNSFLSNNRDASYNFPNGENVKRHNNFRIIAAGNTAGNGADANYNTREKIEESVQQRFTPIYVGYDNYVEEKILGDYKDWYNFIVLFRNATDAWGASNDCSAAGILTTRDACKIKRYLDNKSFDAGKILDYEFIQTKDMEYLAFLVSHMKGEVQSHPEVAGIFSMFEEKVNELRERGGRR